MYEVFITKVETVERKKRSYEKLRDRLESDVADNYGYVDTVLPQTDRTELLRQTVDQIDLVKVIKAINGID